MINHTMSRQSGFTLIELMIVVIIVAILAAIAIPSYRQYMVKNAESQAQVRMKQLQLELETWRATNLTYKGFVPTKVATDGTATYAYDSEKTIQVPDTTNPRYSITLESGSGSALNSTGTIASTTYNKWRMLAVPVGNIADYGANKFTLNSQGLACKSSPDLAIDITGCPTGAQAW